MSFGPGRAVSASLQWSMPADLDVPVHHYKVSWSWTAAGQPSASSLSKRRKTVREVRKDGDAEYVLRLLVIYIMFTRTTEEEKIFVGRHNSP